MESLPPRVRQTFFIAFGFLTLALGIIGILLPLLPTTPFLLLSAWAWAKSSPRFYAWLVGNKFLGTYIRNYKEKKGITPGHRMITLTILWVGIGYAAIFVATRLWLTVLLFVIAAGVTAHLLMLKKLPRKKKEPAVMEKPQAPGGSEVV
jgi:uncharacterized protein